MNIVKRKYDIILLIILVFLISLKTMGAVTVNIKEGKQIEGSLIFENGFVYIKTRDSNEKIDFNKISSIKFNDVVNTYVLIPAERQPPQILIRHGVPLEQSESDALNGIAGTGVNYDKKGVIKLNHLSDARNSKEPSEDNGWFAGEIIWDLGDNVSPLERELAEVSIWIRADDRHRCDFSGSLEISEGGKIFIPVEGTYTNVNFYELFGRGFANTYNNVRYYFAPGSVSGFRYLKLKVNPSAQSHCESRFVEVDAFINRIKVPPPRVISIVLENGTILNGIWKQMDDVAIRITVEKKDLVVPLPKISKILFRNPNQDHQKVLNGERIGVLLCNGDFIDGEVASIDEDILSITSTTLGERKFSIRLNVVAVVFKKTSAEKFYCEVTTKFGSIFKVQNTMISSNGIELSDSILGKINLDFDKIARIDFSINR